MSVTRSAVSMPRSARISTSSSSSSVSSSSLRLVKMPAIEPISSREERDRPSRSRWNQLLRGSGAGPAGRSLGLLFDQLADGDLAGGTRSGNRGRCGRRRGGGRHRRYERRMGPRLPGEGRALRQAVPGLRPVRDETRSAARQPRPPARPGSTGSALGVSTGAGSSAGGDRTSSSGRRRLDRRGRRAVHFAGRVDGPAGLPSKIGSAAPASESGRGRLASATAAAGGPAVISLSAAKLSGASGSSSAGRSSTSFLPKEKTFLMKPKAMAAVSGRLRGSGRRNQPLTVMSGDPRRHDLAGRAVPDRDKCETFGAAEPGRAPPVFAACVPSSEARCR